MVFSWSFFRVCVGGLGVVGLMDGGERFDYYM